MGLLDRLFGNKKDEARVEISTVAQSRTIGYDPKLVANLKHDHQNLVALFGNVRSTVEQSRPADTGEALRSFKTGLEAHLLMENVRFYTYLQQSMVGDDENLALMHGFRREMNGIARAVVDFVRRYQDNGVNMANRSAFLAEYDKIGGLLAQRIEREESSLYPMYRQ